MRRDLIAFGLAVVVMAGVAWGEEGAAPAGTRPGAGVALPVYTIGEKVEVKKANSWDEAKIINRDGEVYLVNYDKFKSAFFNEWVTLDRIRRPGETRDTPGWATPTAHGQKPGKDARLQALVNLGLATPAQNVARRGAASGGLTPINWAGVKEVGMGEEGKGFAADAEVSGKWSTGGVGLGPVQRTGTNQMSGLLGTSVGTGKIGISYQDWAMQHLPERVQIADLKSQQANVVITLPEGERAMCLSPDGKRVLMVLKQEMTGRNGTMVDVGEISGTSVKSISTFMPGGKEENEREREVTWGAFVDRDHVLVQEDGGRATLFAVSEGKAVYTTTETIGVPGLSGSRKYAAFSTRSGLVVVDALTGETAVSVAKGSLGGAAFSPDGGSVATFWSGQIKVCDLVKKEVSADISLPPKMTVTSLEWVAPNFLLMNGMYLVSVSKGVILWKYERPEDFGGETMLGGSVWVAYVRNVGTGAQAKSVRTLMPVTLPDAAAKEMEGKLRVEDLMAIRPGVKVTVDVSVGNEEGNAALRKRFSEELMANGMEVAEGQNMRLEARTAADKSHEMEYQEMGGKFERTKMTVNDTKVWVSFMVEGKEAWTWSAIQAVPMSVPHAAGTSLQEAIAAEQAKAWQMLNGVELPRMVAAPREKVEFGSSPLVPGVAKK